MFKVNNKVLVFSCEFCEISKDTFFTEHLRTTASRKTGVNIVPVLKNKNSSNLLWTFKKMFKKSFFSRSILNLKKYKLRIMLRINWLIVVGQKL